MRLPVALSLALIAASLAGGASAAGDKLRLGIFGSGKGTGPLLTRAELRECLALQERVRSGGETATRDREQIDKEKSDLIRQGDELKADLDKLDRASAEAIEQYRARVVARDKAIDLLDARAAEFNTRVGGLNADRSAFAQRCDNRRFDEIDEAAIRNGK
ncbi:MAG: hypothetical protein QM722_11925 [Piscinibacter sp.]